jgi:hypothetical protein
MTILTPIRRTTADGLRVTIEDGFLYLGFNAVHRKPLTPSEVALVSGVVELCDGDELKAAVRLARKLATPGAILAALEAAKNPRRSRPAGLGGAMSAPAGTTTASA